MKIEKGQRFGRLVVIEKIGSRKYNGYSRSLWKCVCDCGQERVFETRSLTSSHTRSCGCMANESRSSSRLLKKYNDEAVVEKYKHLHTIWRNIISRCTNKNHKEFYRYGGRGIIVCEEWRNNSRAFIEWGLEHGYEVGLSIDRIDNDGNYEPLNCVFITRSDNSKKKRNSKYLTANGLTMTLCEWSKHLDKNPGFLGYWNRKYGIERANDVLQLELSHHAQ